MKLKLITKYNIKHSFFKLFKRKKLIQRTRFERPPCKMWSYNNKNDKVVSVDWFGRYAHWHLVVGDIFSKLHWKNSLNNFLKCWKIWYKYAISWRSEINVSLPEKWSDFCCSVYVGKRSFLEKKFNEKW